MKKFKSRINSPYSTKAKKPSKALKWQKFHAPRGPAKLFWKFHKSLQNTLLHPDLAQKKLGEALEDTEDGQHLYHVTHTHHVASIQKHGLHPRGAASNWVEAGSGKRYGKGEIYTFTHHNDAKRWAMNMDWAHHQKLGSGKISILKVKHPADHPFEEDRNDPLETMTRKGKALKTNRPISSSHIVSVSKFTTASLKESNMNIEDKEQIGTPTPSLKELAKKHGRKVSTMMSQMRKGIAVEKEHTDSIAQAAEIARDHLDEFPDYYDRLGKMEDKAKKDMREESVEDSIRDHPRGPEHAKKLLSALSQQKKDAKKMDDMHNKYVFPTNKLKQTKLKEAEKRYTVHKVSGERGDPTSYKIKDNKTNRFIHYHDYANDAYSHSMALNKAALKEEGAGMSVGAGVIAGMPTADSADTSVPRPIGSGSVQRRKRIVNGKVIFASDPRTYNRATNGKKNFEHYEYYLAGDPILEEIREYVSEDKEAPVILQNEQTGAMIYIKYGSK